jgi:hypothetical protein
MNLMKKESDSESDELLNLLMQDPVKQEEERLAQEGESQRRRPELEKDAAISSFLQALKKRRCENGIDKDSSDAGREEQEEAGRKGQECPLWDERNLKRELLSFQSQVPRGWMTIDHCVRVDSKQVFWWRFCYGVSAWSNIWRGRCAAEVVASGSLWRLPETIGASWGKSLVDSEAFR